MYILYIYIPTYVDICIHTYIHTHIHTHIHSSKVLNVYVYIPMYLHLCIYTYIYICIHTHTHSLKSVNLYSSYRFSKYFSTPAWRRSFRCPLLPHTMSSLTVEVSLLSGKTATLQADLEEEVNMLQLRAQSALGVAKGRLVDSFGQTLDACALVKNSRLQSGDSLTLHISKVHVCGNNAAFAAILGDASVVTWGHAGAGGDSSAVQDQLKNVHQIQAGRFAFAAILGNGSVVTWGDARHGGDSSALRNQLRTV